MKKKLFAMILVSCLLGCSFIGCSEKKAEETTEATETEETTLQVCSGCEEEKECQTYTVDGTDYIVCDDCYQEFAEGMGLIETDGTMICSGCEEEKECKTYTVDGTDYIVCDDCYPEFAEGMGLIDNSASTATTTIEFTTVCSGCEQEKDCKTYTVNGKSYLVCDDCYPEFAEGMGLIEDHEESHHTTAATVCTGCEQEKACKTYTVNGESYLVCDDCYDEFATGMGLKDDTTASNYTTVCSGCKEAKDCKTYCVNDIHYLVCDDCYPEFATGMGLEATVNANCSLCDVNKICKTYTVDGQDYIVCDDCYNEFATAFGLN